MTLPQLIDAMEEAGTTDLRGQEDLPLALRRDRAAQGPRLAGRGRRCERGRRAGAHRIDRNRDGDYEHADAIRIMDAWWPRWVAASSSRGMGAPLLDQLRATHEIDNAPNNHGDHLGSAYQDRLVRLRHARTCAARPRTTRSSGRYAPRVLRARQPQRAAAPRCIASLRAAIARSPATGLSGRRQGCKTAGDQWCCDAVRFRPLGGVTQPLIHWINRPTYQQVLEIQGHR